MNSASRLKGKSIRTTSGIFLAGLWLLSAAAPLFSQQEVVVEVFLSGKVALTDRFPLHYTGLVNSEDVSAAVLDTLDRVLVRDLTLSGFFDLRLPNIPPDTLRSLSQSTITYLDGGVQAAEKYRAEMHLRTAFRGAPFWQNTYEFPPEKARAAAHRIAADLIRQMTGEPSVMQSRIAFRGVSSTGKEIYSTTFDGFDLVQHTQQNTSVFSPAWSPDGTRLAYTSFAGGQADLYILNVADGENRLFLGTPSVDSAPDWSPDGNWIAYSSAPDGNAEIYVRRVDGGESKRLTYSWAIETSPSWSPTGREIAFTSDRLGKPQVFIMDADGANQRRLTTVGEYNDSPVWSPRGDMIAYIRRDADGFQIYLTDPRGENHVKLTSGPGDNMDPAWSPDGLRLAFASNRTGIFQIYTMDIFGRSTEQVTNTRMACNGPAWSPILQNTDDIIITSKNN